MRPGMLAIMSLLHGPLVDTPLHPSVQAFRRKQILEEGYREHKRVKAYEEQVKAGFLTLDEARARIYGR